MLCSIPCPLCTLRQAPDRRVVPLHPTDLLRPRAVTLGAGDAGSHLATFLSCDVLLQRHHVGDGSDRNQIHSWRQDRGVNVIPWHHAPAHPRQALKPPLALTNDQAGNRHEFRSHLQPVRTERTKATARFHEHPHPCTAPSEARDQARHRGQRPSRAPPQRKHPGAASREGGCPGTAPAPPPLTTRRGPRTGPAVPGPSAGTGTCG